MTAGRLFSEWLRVSNDGSRARVQRSCERKALRRCRRGCMRATLNPCIDACIRMVAEPSVCAIGLPCILTYIFKSRTKLLNQNKDRPDKEQRALNVFTTYCLKTCAPQWMKQWKEFCDILFKRVCIRMCTCVCERNCRRSCRLPCTRTPLQRLYGRSRAQLRVSTCLLSCIAACVKACMRTSELLVPKWLHRKGKHICRPAINKSAQRLAAKWLAEDIVKERRLMTDKCNILNSCKF